MSLSAEQRDDLERVASLLMTGEGDLDVETVLVMGELKATGEYDFLTFSIDTRDRQHRYSVGLEIDRVDPDVAAAEVKKIILKHSLCRI